MNVSCQREVELSYFCCSCRFKDGSNTSIKKDCSNDESFSQLLEMVGALAGQVRDLVDKESMLDNAGLREKHIERATEKQGLAAASNLTQSLLQSEIREFHERKRISSIIIRGCPAKKVEDIQQVVDQVCHEISIDRVLLQNVYALNKKGLYRAKVDNDEGRRKFLQNVKKLIRHLEKYRTMFINRDLTYLQRQQLKAQKELGGKEEISNQGRSIDSRQGPKMIRPVSERSVGGQVVGRGRKDFLD